MAEDATALAEAIRSGQTDPAQVMRASVTACADRADLGAIALMDAEMGIAAAKAARGHLTGAPFAAIPFLGKDLGTCARGLPVAAGNPALRAAPGETGGEDSALFAQFRAAGLLPFGLTSVPEFGLCLTTEAPGAAPTLNPWDRALSPGGSSGGAACAVAAGLVAIAHATDAAGSIRVPAACCGLVGLKPSRGAISGAPSFANHLAGLASELVLARSVRDVETAFAATQPPSAAQRGSALIIAYVIPAETGPQQRAAVIDAARYLTQAGHQVREIPAHALAPLSARSARTAHTILGVAIAEAVDNLGLGSDSVTPLTGAVAREGRTATATTLMAALTEMARLDHALDTLLGDAAALVLPVLSGPPPPVGHFDTNATDTDAHFAKMEALAPAITLANVTGRPACSVPVITQSDTLPASVQILGPAGGDRTILRLAAQIEAATPALSFPYRIAGLP